MVKAKDIEFDLHVWLKPETAQMMALATISRGKRALCIDMPLQSAARFIEMELEAVLARGE